MKLHQLENRAQSGYVTWGATWEKGTVREDSSFVLTNEKGETVPVQSSVAAYWPDHSVKWTSHSADAALIGACGEILPTEEKRNSERIAIEERENCLAVTAGSVSVNVRKTGNPVLTNLKCAGEKEIREARLILILEETAADGEDIYKKQSTYYGETREVQVEECGELKCVIRIEGVHRAKKNGRECCPFVLRVTIWNGSSKVDFQHTFIYDGNVSSDSLKGLGIQFLTGLEGAVYNRHVRMLGDHGDFHEPAVLLTIWRPRIPMEWYEAQLRGEELPTEDEVAEPFRQALEAMPIWNNYRLLQDAASHYVIEKQTSQTGCCFIEAQHGNRAPGAMAFGDAKGGFLVGKKDFWQKYPSSFEVNGLAEEETCATVWFWSPQVRAFDYRHYATRGYSQAYYEGFDEFGATPYGIANTNECSIEGYNGMIVSCDRLQVFNRQVQKPAVYLGDISYYHELRAFGYWSLKETGSAMERWLEDQLERAVDFYKNEVEIRNWYGFYNYGDFMHTYDRVRHCWKYDMGGYAWQNTELVPTLWLWLYFMRTQREDVFVLAEAMSRHCSEVDTYHMGPYKGIGSRHNVRHWGCSCKEARIGMAGHHRYYYYLTGDGRMKDVFDDVKDGDFALLNIDPLRFFYEKEKMVSPTHARSGPDWSTFCSNWMTQWERFDDKTYLEKIRTGIEDLKQTPLKLVSGSDFEYDPADSHLRYIGEKSGGGSHLQICMGGAQVWSELTLLLDDPEWTKMYADYGRFYYSTAEEQAEQSNGFVKGRFLSIPYLAAATGAFGAWYHQDEKLAKTTWRILMRAMISDYDTDGLQIHPVKDAGNQESLPEIDWVTTNFVSQWCLNVIMVLEFIRDQLPADWEEMKELMKGMPNDGFHKC
ncbi:MAG: hypothetical protein IJ468_01905 [Lachnospiraceae bacterium]|nr:hypothetical protein [Lachnospiraceae bacterium]